MKKLIFADIFSFVMYIICLLCSHIPMGYEWRDVTMLFIWGEALFLVISIMIFVCILTEYLSDE